MSDVQANLAAEAGEAEARADEPPARMHRTRVAGGTSHVYTVRMPAERLAELRVLAEQLGEPPSALMRRWVLERLDDERPDQSELADVQRSLAEALHALDRIAARRSA